MSASVHFIEYTGCTQGRAGCIGHAQDIKVCADVVGTQDGGATDRGEGESEALKLRNSVMIRPTTMICISQC